MQEQPITLADIRREAMLLEFDVDISTGHLDIIKRSDASSAFYSLQEANDPRVLLAAWQFLQFYRFQLEQFDTARGENANRSPRRPHKAFSILYRLVGILLAGVVGEIVAASTNDILLALLVFVLLFAIVGLLRPRWMC